MIIEIPKEIKASENRVALVPSGVEAMVADGHTVLVEESVGKGSGFGDEVYAAAGATIAAGVDEVWDKADMIMKVKEPIESEWRKMKSGQVIFTYFHFAANEDLTRAVVESKCVAIAYETVQLSSGELPLLIPMSEVAGRMAIQEGAKYVEAASGAGWGFSWEGSRASCRPTS